MNPNIIQLIVTGLVLFGMLIIVSNLWTSQAFIGECDIINTIIGVHNSALQRININLSNPSGKSDQFIQTIQEIKNRLENGNLLLEDFLQLNKCQVPESKL
jgi:hypothetical protein